MDIKKAAMEKHYEWKDKIEVVSKAPIRSSEDLSLAFPGIFRGVLDVRASDINEEMKMAAAYAIASLVSDGELNAEYILPGAFDERTGKAVAAAAEEAAGKTCVARL